MAQVSLKAIKKNYGATQVIKGVDIEIGDGEFVVFVGPSGCGKSTLLRMIAGLEDISGGTLTIGDTVVNDLPPKDRRIAMVFQSYAIFPHMTVRENLAFGLTIANAPQAEKDAKVAEAARILQMEHLLDRRPSQLSGGQRQRVAIGMELSKLHADLGATMVYVTHDQVEAMTLADKIVVLNGGVVQQIGTPLELYHTPANLFVAGFMGSPKMNLLKAGIEAIGPDSVTVTSHDLGSMVLPRTNPELKLGDDVTVGLRPHHLGETGDHRIEGRIVLVERLGNETLAAMQLKSGQQIIAALPGDVAVAAGETLSLATQADKASLFLPSGDAA